MTSLRMFSVFFVALPFVAASWRLHDASGTSSTASQHDLGSRRSVSDQGRATSLQRFNQTATDVDNTRPPTARINLRRTSVNATRSFLCRVVRTPSCSTKNRRSSSAFANIDGARLRRQLLSPENATSRHNDTDNVGATPRQTYVANRSPASGGGRNGGSRSQVTSLVTNVNVTIVFQKDRGLSAVVNFRLEPAGSVTTSSTIPLSTSVVVHWMTLDCSVDPSFPPCEEANKYESRRVKVPYGKNFAMQIDQLMYNTKYQVHFEIQSEAMKPFVFNTPGCYEIQPGTWFRRCKEYSKPAPDEGGNASGGWMTSLFAICQGNIVNPKLLVNISCVERIDNLLRNQTSKLPTTSARNETFIATTSPINVIGVWIVWHLPSNDVIRSSLESRNSSAPSSNHDGGHATGPEAEGVLVEAGARWTMTVHVNGVDDYILQDKALGNRIRLELKPNKVYEISVAARSMTHEVADVVYRRLHVNTTEILTALLALSRGAEPNISARSSSQNNALHLCPQQPGPAVAAATGGPFGLGDERSTGVMIGVLAVGTVCLTALAAAFHKRCQRRIRNVFIAGKPPVMHCNSYEKSSPSGSFHLLRTGRALHGQTSVSSDIGHHQLDVLTSNTCDEWEVDAREVALGIEIGQGAFGRVLTGFYRGNQVAIKVLKDHIPDSYRDDLLREIALMKGIGLHPNIVMMVGACTTHDPIALILEYVPFGNLQAFLKKCRVDRESHCASDRDNITYCLVDELSGHKECWHITANDMLSFARQVANAMEFLSERHFVHRDLAARNILLGYNKVVKVCDFGLARAVYTGDQYYKMTSGRLPLKWMALESIRDRVFTTCSDVWSFGVLLWEIVTMGASPYPNIALADVYRLLAEGYRMQQPKNCSDELYDIMSQCWCENPADRPSFCIVRRQLEHLLCRSVDYLDLDNIDAPLAPRSQSTVDSAATATCCAAGAATGILQGAQQLLLTSVTSTDAAGRQERSALLLCGSSEEDEEDENAGGGAAMLHLDIC